MCGSFCSRPSPPGVVADVFVVGGATMALAYDAARVTWDVDAVFMPHGIVVEKAPARLPTTSDYLLVA